MVPDTLCPPAGREAPKRPRRILSVFRMGLIAVLVTLLAGVLPSRGRFIPEPWPSSIPSSAATAQPRAP